MNKQKFTETGVYSVEQVAEYFDTNTRTIVDWVNEGLLKRVVLTENYITGKSILKVIELFPDIAGCCKLIESKKMELIDNLNDLDSDLIEVHKTLTGINQLKLETADNTIINVITYILDKVNLSDETRRIYFAWFNERSTISEIMEQHNLSCSTVLRYIQATNKVIRTYLDKCVSTEVKYRLLKKEYQELNTKFTELIESITMRNLKLNHSEGSQEIHEDNAKESETQETLFLDTYLFEYRLNFTPRLRNILFRGYNNPMGFDSWLESAKSKNLVTVRDLVENWTKADLIKAHRNFGSKSIKELSDWLSKYGLKLKS